MTADLDLSPEAVERLARDLEDEAVSAQRDAWSCLDGGQDYSISAMLADKAAAVILALAAENARLRAERDAAWQAGAEAMREAAARTADKHPYPAKTAESLWGIERTCIGNAIRALPLPSQPKGGE